MPETIAEPDIRYIGLKDEDYVARLQGGVRLIEVWLRPSGGLDAFEGLACISSCVSLWFRNDIEHLLLADFVSKRVVLVAV